MEENIQLLIEAIKDTAQPNYLKDYLLPLAIVLLGGFVAHYSTAYMRYLDFQKQKLDIANDWILGLQEAFQTLVTIKQIYQQKIINLDKPIERAVKIPELIIHSRALVLSISKLSFVAQPITSIHDKQSQLRNPAYIAILQRNFNQILSILNTRNNLAGNFLPQLGTLSTSTSAYVDVSMDEIREVVDFNEFLEYVRLTEILIKRVDDMLIAIHNFLCKFPDACRLTIDTQRIKHYGKLIEHVYDRMEIFEKCPAVNINLMNELFNVEEDILITWLTTYYEDDRPIVKTTEFLNRPKTVNENIEEDKLKQKIKKAHRYWWC